MMRAVLAALLATLVLAESAGADVVVLKDQRRFAGTLANRDEFARSPGRSPVALLPADSASLVRFQRSEISHVILEDGVSTRVFDLTTPPLPAPAALPLPASRISSVDSWNSTGAPRGGSLRAAGTGLCIAGVAALTLGLAVKFGEFTFLSSHESYYNGANYACMGGGGAMMMVGVALLSVPEPVAVAPAPGGARVAVAVRF